MNLKKHFSKDELKSIELAVQEAEKSHCGEIVPVFVERCDDYSYYKLRLGVLAALIIFLLIIFMDRFVPGIYIYDPLIYFLLSAGGGILAYFAVANIPALLRATISQKVLLQSAETRSDLFFLREEVFKTEQRTGIMIFIALFEHLVIVKADEGISAVVEQKEWQSVVQTMINDIKQGQLAQSIIDGIGLCADLLNKKGQLVESNENDQLSNQLRGD